MQVWASPATGHARPSPPASDRNRGSSRLTLRTSLPTLAPRETPPLLGASCKRAAFRRPRVGQSSSGGGSTSPRALVSPFPVSSRIPVPPKHPPSTLHHSSVDHVARLPERHWMAPERLRLLYATPATRPSGSFPWWWRLHLPALRACHVPPLTGRRRNRTWHPPSTAGSTQHARWALLPRVAISARSVDPVGSCLCRRRTTRHPARSATNVLATTHDPNHRTGFLSNVKTRRHVASQRGTRTANHFLSF